MSTLPKIAIQVCTYDRYNELLKTVAALQNHLIYPADRVKLYICDDSTGEDYFNRLKRLKVFRYWETVWISTDKNSGWGANVNTGLSQIKEDYIFFLEDDYVLHKALDLRIGVALLEQKPQLGMLRYRGTSGSHLVYHQFEASLKEYTKDPAFSGSADERMTPWTQSLSAFPWLVTYLQLGGGSPDLYLYSHGPHLKTKKFHEFYGKYPEGMKLGATEEAFAHTVKDKMRTEPDRAPGIAILPEWVPMWFDHIGQSYQNTEKDK